MSQVTNAELYTILNLPKNLQTTAAALIKLGVATASQVAACTGKSRPTECNLLNQLARMHIATRITRLKNHRGRRRLYFQYQKDGR